MTLCPGRRDRLSVDGPWDRDLDADLDLIASWQPSLVIAALPIKAPDRPFSWAGGVSAQELDQRRPAIRRAGRARATSEHPAGIGSAPASGPTARTPIDTAPAACQRGYPITTPVSPPARVGAFLLAQYVVVNNQTRNASLTEIFEALALGGPFIVANFAIFAQLYDLQTSDLEVHAIILDPNGNQLGATPATTGTINPAELPVNFTSMLSNPVVFAAPGVFSVVLFVNGQEVARRPLKIVQAPSPVQVAPQ